MEVSDWASVAAAFALVGATLVLAWFTRALYKATGQLANATEQLRRIEERRDREEARRRRRNRVEERLKLADEVIHMPPQHFLDILAQGSLPEGHARTLRELHTLLDYGEPSSDEVRRVDMDELMRALDNADDRGASLGEEAVKKLGDALRLVQKRLQWSRPRWREEVIGLKLSVV